ncbi:MAG: NAD-dependent epimerase/dehydratase family protein [Deltaproteobacteria bacterium]|nr:NAD-dependent epimerase/dehydratase family protein [Deltaproteobacteria bacterium]
MKVIVTGASGFLGSHVAELLCAGGQDVRALVRRSSDTSFLRTLNRVELVYGAVEDRPSVEAAVQGVDAVVHAAALVKARSSEEFVAVNVEGTRNVLDAVPARAPGLRRFVLVSSLAAVGPSPDGRPVDPAQAAPVTRYGRSKLEAERVVTARAQDVPVVILRPSMIYGPRDKESLAFFQSVSRGVLPLVGAGRNTVSAVYASDAARACLRAIDADVPSGAAFFVDDGQRYVWREMVREIERALGKRAVVRIGLPLAVFRLVAAGAELYGRLSGKAVMLTRDKLNELAAPYWVCDSTPAREFLGWEPEVPWADGVRRSVAWYREQGWL